MKDELREVVETLCEYHAGDEIPPELLEAAEEALAAHPPQSEPQGLREKVVAFTKWRETWKGKIENDDDWFIRGIEYASGEILKALATPAQPNAPADGGQEPQGLREEDIVRIIHQESSLRGIKAHRIARAVLALAAAPADGGLMKAAWNVCDYFGAATQPELEIHLKGYIDALRAALSSLPVTHLRYSPLEMEPRDDEQGEPATPVPVDEKHAKAREGMAILEEFQRTKPATPEGVQALPLTAEEVENMLDIEDAEKHPMQPEGAQEAGK
jgi:hypothetical protein